MSTVLFLGCWAPPNRSTIATGTSVSVQSCSNIFFQTFEQISLLPRGNKITFSITPFSLHDKVLDSVFSSDTVIINTKVSSYESVSLHLNPAVQSCWSNGVPVAREKRGVTMFTRVEKVCVEEYVKRVSSIFRHICWEQQCVNSHSKTRIKTSGKEE